MSSPDSVTDRLQRFVRVWVDAVVYALAVTVVAAIGSLIVGVATGGGAARGKLLLFVVGWILLGYATVRLWPTSPEDVTAPTDRYRGKSVPKEHDTTRFQAFVRLLPPVRWIRPPPLESRVTVPGKLLLGSLMVLLLSFLMETVFGVG